MSTFLTFCRAVFCFTVFLPVWAVGQQIIPNFTQVSLRADTTNQTLTILYDLVDDNPEVDVRFLIVNSDGVSVEPGSGSATGDLGVSVQPGKGKKISWHYQDVKPSLDQFTLKLIADDHHPVDVQQLINQVDEKRLQQRLKRIIGLRNPVSEAGKQQLNQTRKLINNVFNKAGFQTQLQSFIFGDYQGQNVIGRKSGTLPNPFTYVVAACFDTYDSSPGANSNGSGLVGMLEIADILSNYQLKNNVIAAGFDYSIEEYVGCNNFLFHGGLRPHERLDGAFDLDKIGRYDDKPNSYPKDFPISETNRAYMEKNEYRGNFVRVVTDKRSRVLADRFKTCASNYVPGLTVLVEAFDGYGEFADGQNFFFQQSDHIPFWYRKQKAIWINDGKSGDRDDDTSGDVESKINYKYLKKIVQTTLATVAEMAGIEQVGVYEAVVNLNAPLLTNVQNHN